MLHVEHISYLITNHAQSLVNSSPLDKMTTISQMMCDMAFIEPMHRNKANITYLLHRKNFHMYFREWKVVYFD